MTRQDGSSESRMCMHCGGTGKLTGIAPGYDRLASLVEESQSSDHKYTYDDFMKAAFRLLAAASAALDTGVTQQSKVWFEYCGAFCQGVDRAVAAGDIKEGQGLFLKGAVAGFAERMEGE